MYSSKGGSCWSLFEFESLLSAGVVFAFSGIVSVVVEKLTVAVDCLAEVGAAADSGGC